MKLSIFLLGLLVFGFSASSQITLWANNKQYLVTHQSIVKDSTGKSYQYASWINMLTSGEYDITLDKGGKEDHYLLTSVPRDEQKRRLEAAPKPGESKAFKGKKKIESFEAVDIRGRTVNTKNLKGKIVVLNFWFIRCPPCRMERPYLNEIVNEYKKDSNVVFIAVALDPKQDLENYLKDNPFHYQVIPDGRKIAGENKVEQYPTHAILDKEGKIVFNSISYNSVTGHWIRKTINELGGRSL